MKKLIYLSFILLLIACQSTETNLADNASKNSYNIIPLPTLLNAKSGTFKVNENTSILIPADNEDLKRVATMLSDYIPALQEKNIETSSTISENAIIFSLNETLVGEEDYTLVVDERAILVTSKTSSGAFYALQTLRQLHQNNTIPALTIKDSPRFSYRGMHLDVSRHFFDIQAVKRFIDQLAYHKLNTFHWHLTDDQGWRVEIKQFPKLTEVSAYREETLIGHYNDEPHQFDGQRYGGFYTQEEIKEVVQYAKDRFITVIPEIELPGHSVAVLAAYPELACTDGPFETGTKWGVFDDVFCPKEETFDFLEKVLTEVMNLFPSEYIHIGGDECPKTKWKESAFCQNLIKEKGLKDEHGLQSYFIQRIEKFLNSKGRQIIGWDEILEGGLAPNATVMSWRGEDGGIEAAQQKHEVIMTPTTYCYFDYYQSQAASEPLAIGGFLPLKKVYDYNPVPAVLNAEEKEYIKGVQANLWTEYITDIEKLDYMMFPRACALAEIAWTPHENKDYSAFIDRLVVHLDRLKKMGINSANHLYDVQTSIVAGKGKGVLVTAGKESKEGVLRYTMDGRTPDINSNLYKNPITITEGGELKIQSLINGEAIGNGKTEIFNWHKGVGKKTTFNVEPHEKYPGNGFGSVTNGVFGDSERYGGSEWLGFLGEDVICDIDLGAMTDLSKVDMRFYKGEGQRIYLPKSVKILVSDDGQNYRKIAETQQIKGENKLVKMSFDLPKTKAQFLKIKAETFGLIPDGAQGAGNVTWLFLDEISVN